MRRLSLTDTRDLSSARQQSHIPISPPVYLYRTCMASSLILHGPGSRCLVYAAARTHTPEMADCTHRYLIYFGTGFFPQLHFFISYLKPENPQFPGQCGKGQCRDFLHVVLVKDTLYFSCLFSLLLCTEYNGTISTNKEQSSGTILQVTFA